MNNKLLIPALIAVSLVDASSALAADKTSRGFYVGGFGGGGTSDNNNISQSGEAFKRDAEGENFIPGYADSHHDFNLLVNTLGHSDSHTAALGGVHVGYEFPELPMGNNSSGWGVRPAVELEGYYLGSSISGTLTNPNPETFDGLDGHPAYIEETSQLDPGQHKFVDKFSQNMGVLLTNAVFSFKTPWAKNIFPYVGGGIGAAINSLSGATSTQIASGSPYAGTETVNHFNSDTNATSSAFAAQAKAGVRAELFDRFSLFAEYRYLHVTDSSYTFGSTEYGTDHAKTSNWNVGLGSMNYHTGVFGVQYDF